MSPVEGEDSPVVYYTPGSSAFFTSLPPLLSLVFGSTSLVLVVILAFARARARRREHDLRRLLLGDGSFLEGLISKANATCLSTNTTVKTSHLETNCQILTLKKKETYRTWYLWQKNAPMWMVERVKEERKEDGGYGDSRRRDHWIVEWVDEGPPVVATSPLTLTLDKPQSKKTLFPPAPPLNTISLSALPHHPVLSTFASTNVMTGVQEAVGYTNSKETRGAKVGDRRWCFKAGYMEGERLAVVGAGGASKVSGKSRSPGTPVFHFDKARGTENGNAVYSEDSVNENTPLSISMDIEYGGTRRTSVQEEILEALNSPLKLSGAEVAPFGSPEEGGKAVDDESVIKGVVIRGSEKVVAIERPS
ncbi:hypothetical protein TrRE_jg11662 [Triparma retinervis]|uniref:Uncharacterized protein n=1 Tax=Triparma retinervis TaxID=2557542 RepID=A0A9W6ZXE8_9STRA|nr:hypothetical protein TrRE_jg11662 [Triparma retinervis]